MPSGIILSSASQGATQKDVDAVLEKHGYEVDKPEPEKEPEPQRDAFESDEDFELAHEEWQAKQEPPKEEKETPAVKAEEDDDEEEPRKPSKFQKRINKLVNPLKQRIAELERQLGDKGKSGDKSDDKEEEAAKRPARADFQNDQEYEDALLAWGVEKALAEKTVREAEKRDRETLEQNFTSYRNQVEAFKEEHDDWDEVVNQDIPMHQSVQLAVMEQENGAAVIYYLGTHPEYARKLAELTPLSAVMEIGRLSEKLKPASGSAAPSAGRGEPPKPKPKVPAPVRPVSTAATSSTLTSRDAAASGNYRAFKAAQRAGR